ncbi:flavodoxin family protein [Natronospora cellulosivora (SeqCode)]
MRVLLLNALKEDSGVNNFIEEIITKELAFLACQSKLINVREKEIEYCTGCGYCGEKEPGVCIKKDDMQEIYPEMANSEMYILISSISFGGFHSELKKVIDRICPLALSTYNMHRGELHHVMRYPNPRHLLSIGFMFDDIPEQKKTYKLATERIEKAFFVEKAATLTFRKDQERDFLAEEIKKAISELELIL